MDHGLYFPCGVAKGKHELDLCSVGFGVMD